MFNRRSSFRLLAIPAFIFLILLADLPPRYAPGAPAPKPQAYALLYFPTKKSLYETNQFRRRQIALVKTDNAPFILYWAIRSLKGAHLPSLPKKGKGERVADAHEEDVAWMKQNLKIEYLDGTGVLRISLSAGTPREQALIVNAIVGAYFKLEVRQRQRSCEVSLERRKRVLKTSLEDFEKLTEAEKKLMEPVIAEYKANVERSELELRTPPLLLELAEVPPE